MVETNSLFFQVHPKLPVVPPSQGQLQAWKYIDNMRKTVCIGWEPILQKGFCFMENPHFFGGTEVQEIFLGGSSPVKAGLRNHMRIQARKNPALKWAKENSCPFWWAKSVEILAPHFLAASPHVSDLSIILI